LPATRPSATLAVLLKMSAPLPALRRRSLLLRLITVSSARTTAATATATARHARVVPARSVAALAVGIGPRFSFAIRAFAIRPFAEISGFPIRDIAVRRLAIAEVAERAFRLDWTCIERFRT
jgi:hypothetical protein